MIILLYYHYLGQTHYPNYCIIIIIVARAGIRRRRTCYDTQRPIHWDYVCFNIENKYNILYYKYHMVMTYKYVIISEYAFLIYFCRKLSLLYWCVKNVIISKIIIRIHYKYTCAYTIRCPRSIYILLYYKMRYIKIINLNLSRRYYNE